MSYVRLESDHARQRTRPLATMPVSVPARQVRLGNKKVRIMVKKVHLGIKKRSRPLGASWDQEGRMEEWSREILNWVCLPANAVITTTGLQQC